MATTSEEREAQAQFDRASSYQTVWLNDVFRFRDKAIRLLRSGIRLGLFDILWMAFILALLLTIMFGLRHYLGLGGIILFDPIVIILLSVVAAWFIGRRVAHMSPLRRTTGEGTSVWLRQKIKLGTSIVRSKTRGDVSYNVSKSWINGEQVDVSVKEWLGSAPARRAPSFSSEDGNITAFVDLRPLGEQRVWE